MMPSMQVRWTSKTLESVLGTEEALRMKLLRDSIDREPPEPGITEIPSKEGFYDGDVPVWTPDEGVDEDVESTA